MGLTIVYGLLLTTVIGLSALVYLPFNARTGASLIFFEDIAGMGWMEFQSAARNMSHDLMEQQLLHQIYIVSQVSQRQDAPRALGNNTSACRQSWLGPRFWRGATADRIPDGGSAPAYPVAEGSAELG